MKPKAFLCHGRLLKKHDTLTRPAGLIWFPENRTSAREATAKYRAEDIDGEWRLIGKGNKTQVFEYGPGWLGVSVSGNKRIRKFEAAAATGLAIRTQRGDEEANYRVQWTAGALALLASILPLCRRRPKNSSRAVTSGVPKDSSHDLRQNAQMAETRPQLEFDARKASLAHP